MKNIVFLLFTILLFTISKNSSSQTAQWSPGTETFEAGTTLPNASGWATSGTWTINNSGGHSGTNFARLASGITNKWIYSKAFNAIAGHSYFITYWDQGTSSTTAFNLYITTSQAIPGTPGTDYVVSKTAVTSWTVMETSATWTCPSTGTYYWAFRATTAAAQIKIDDVTCYEDCSTNTVTANTFQPNTSTINKCYDNAEVISIVINASIDNCATVSSFTLNANGTTSVADIKNAKIWYTGSNPNFSTSADFGSSATLFGTVASPNIANYSLTGSQTLLSGNNYFWLTYDIKSTATLSNLVDGECTSIMYSSTITPSTTAPAGNRTISYTNSLPAKFRTCASGTTLNLGSSAIAANTFDVPVGISSVSALSSTCNLREVRVKFYGGSGEQIDKYTLVIKAPDGTSISLFSTGSFNNTSGLAKIDSKFRYSSNLYQANYSDYTATSNRSIEPFDQGYYKSETNFTNLNGKDPNGTWQVIITETATAGNDDFKLDYVELEFGPNFTETDVKTQGDNCANAIALTNGVYIGSTSSKTDEAFDPSFPLGGCDWNGSNDNSQWFKFTATQTNISLSISGLTYNAITNNKIQSIVVKNGLTPCSGTGSNWILSSCPRSGSYTANNGTYANHKLDFTAVVGETYYFVVDGDAGGINDYYINVDGAQASIVLAENEQIQLRGKCNANKSIDVAWSSQTSTRINSIELERSIDGLNFISLGKMIFENNDSNAQYTDNEINTNSSYFYRIKTIIANNNISYSKIISITTECFNKTNSQVIIYPNPSQSFINLEINIENINKVGFQIVDEIGRVLLFQPEQIIEPTSNYKTIIDIHSLENGVYFIRTIANSNPISIKFIKN